MDNIPLSEIAKQARRQVLELIYQAKDSHIGCSLSLVDILAVLYFRVLAVDPKNPRDPNRDRFVLSKGHSVSALYSILSLRGFFPPTAVMGYAQDGSLIASHVERDVLPGVETNGGSGGHGLPIAAGMALALRSEAKVPRVYVLMGDGELQEGSVWEALMFASSRKISNLTLIIDRNDFQTWTKINEVVDVEPLLDKLTAFGWDAEQIDGHDFIELERALSTHSDRPRAIIARTIKGKGISFMEGSGAWHNGSPNAEQYETAVRELS